MINPSVKFCDCRGSWLRIFRKLRSTLITCMKKIRKNTSHWQLLRKPKRQGKYVIKTIPYTFGVRKLTGYCILWINGRMDGVMGDRARKREKMSRSYPSLAFILCHVTESKTMFASSYCSTAQSTRAFWHSVRELSNYSIVSLYWIETIIILPLRFRRNHFEYNVKYLQDISAVITALKSANLSQL